MQIEIFWVLKSWEIYFNIFQASAWGTSRICLCRVHSTCPVDTAQLPNACQVAVTALDGRPPKFKQHGWYWEINLRTRPKRAKLQHTQNSVNANPTTGIKKLLLLQKPWNCLHITTVQHWFLFPHLALLNDCILISRTAIITYNVWKYRHHHLLTINIILTNTSQAKTIATHEATISGVWACQSGTPLSFGQWNMISSLWFASKQVSYWMILFWSRCDEYTFFALGALSLTELHMKACMRWVLNSAFNMSRVCNKETFCGRPM